MLTLRRDFSRIVGQNLVEFLVKSLMAMQLRAKRAISRTLPVSNQQRRLADRSKKDAMLFSLLVQPGIDNTTSEGYLRFPGKFRLLVK